MKRAKRWIVLASIGAVAGCAAPQAERPSVGRAAPPVAPAGQDRVLGRDARALQLLFGAPDLDIREGGARKLQFASAVCVLDAYLYPPAEGREAVTRYIDARRPTGEDFDRASCIAALSRRSEAR